MAQMITVARPYAEAAFDLARDDGTLPAWTDGLTMAAQVVADERVEQILRSPRVDAVGKSTLIIDICGDQLDQKQQNLIRLLIEKDRILVLPEISRQFQALREHHERSIEAQLVSAHPVEDATRERLEAALSKQLDRQVTLQTEVDETLIGGAIVRAGDLVIDGSVRGRLAKLTGALSR